MTESNFAPSVPSGNPFPEIRGRTVRVDAAGRVSLTDIWHVGNSPTHQRPGDWRGLPSVLTLIEEVESNVEKYHVSLPALLIKRGHGGGVWAHAILALEYASYLSAELRAEVNDVFIRFKLADPALTSDLLERSSAEALERHANRIDGIRIRHEITDTWKAHGVTGSGFAQCTNAEYRGLMGADAASLVKQRGLPEKTNLRNHLNSTELLEVALTEAYAKELTEALNDQGNAECARTCYVSGKSVRSAREEKERMLQEERKVRGLVPKKGGR